MSPRTGIKTLPPPPSQRPRLVFRCQYPMTENLGTSPRNMLTRPTSMSCHVEDTAQPFYKTEPPVCAHMLLQLRYFTQDNL